MALINVALLLPYTITFEHEKKEFKQSQDKPLLLPLPPQLQQQPHASQTLNDPDVPFDFAKNSTDKHKTRTVSKNIVDDRKQINPKPQVAALTRDTIRRRRNLSVSQSPTNYKIKRQHGGNGSLFNAISRAKAKGIVKDLKWVGCLGVPTDAIIESTRQRIASDFESQQDCFPIFVDDKTYVGHYDHYSKDILFPTFHCQVPEIPKSKSYEDQSWTDYYRVNRQIADKIISVYRRGDDIWIHDYHLMLVPQMVREALPDAPIAFFMHVSFPTSEVFRCLAHRADILQGLLGANSIGFQTDEYAQHFMMTSSRILAFDTSGHVVQTPDLDVHIFVCPIGIDPDRLNELRDSERAEAHRAKIRARWPNTKIIGARDKLDPTRGIVPKLKAYAALLEEFPELAATTVLIQICLPSVSTDSELEAEIAAISDSINTKYGDIAGGVHPVVILRQDVVFEQYLALIAEADVFAVTCLRDGMNLTCHEFVYCNKRNGPLVLSEFTGSASVLGNQSVLVNPWDKNGMKNAFYNSLKMPEQEKKDRNVNLLDTILHHTCIDWVKDSFDQMNKAWQDDQARCCKNPKISELKTLWKTDKSRFITFEIPTGAAAKAAANPADNEDLKRPTLARKASLPSGPSYFSTRLSLTLGKLLDDPQNIIYVSSAESRQYMERSFRQVPAAGLIAESGRYVRLHNTENWIEIDRESDLHWKEDLQPILDTMQERLPIRSLDVHENTIVIDFDFSDDDRDRQLSTIGEYVSLIDDAFSAKGLRCRFQQSQLTVYPLGLISQRTKSLAAILQMIPDRIGPMILATQPLATDEDDILFSQLLDLQAKKRVEELVTILCGNNPSLAQFRVKGINSLMTLLEGVSS